LRNLGRILFLEARKMGKTFRAVLLYSHAWLAFIFALYKGTLLCQSSKTFVVFVNFESFVVDHEQI